MNQQEWNIRPRSESCQVCNRPFADGEEFCSRLDFEGHEGYSRRDLCLACWNASARQGALSVWKAVYRVPPPPPPEPLKKETAESLLRQLMEADDRSKGNTIFILAVMLERRRILAERDVQVREDGVKVRVYEHKKTGETFLVPDPGLKLAQLEQVQREVIEMLGGGKKEAESAPVPEEGEVPGSGDA